MKQCVLLLLLFSALLLYPTAATAAADPVDARLPVFVDQSSSDDPVKRNLVKELLQLTDPPQEGRKYITQTMLFMPLSLDTTLSASQLSEMQKKAAALADQVWGDVTEDRIREVEKEFSSSDIQFLISIFRSPQWKKFVDTAPERGRQILQSSLQRMEAGTTDPHLLAAIKKYRELEKLPLN